MIYSLEIIEELIIAGESKANEKRVQFVEYQGSSAKEKAEQKQETDPESTAETELVRQKSESTVDQQRRQWTAIFLQNGGFKHVLGLFNAKVANLVAAEAYELKQIQFYVTLLSVFLNSAFSTGSEVALNLPS